MFMITDDILESHIDQIVTAVWQIKEGAVTVLVGPNGVGKSLVRSQLSLRFYKETENPHIVRSISMEDRTGSKPELGAFCSILRDDPQRPTSICTFNLIQKMCSQLGDGDKKHYYVIDEPEIGMSKESRLGIASYIGSLLPDIEKHTKGILIITHSEEIAAPIVKAGADFLYLDYNCISTDYETWAARKIEPTDFVWLKDWSGRLFQAISKRQRQKE